MSRKSKRPITKEIEKIIKANSIETTRTLLEIFMKDKNIDYLTKNQALEFFKKWVKKRNEIEIIKPYKLANMIFQLTKISKYFLKDKKCQPVVKQMIKKEANKMARVLFTDNYYAPKKANTFNLKEAASMIKFLWFQGIPEKETSIMMIFIFICGNRVSDLQFTNWSDLLFENTEDGRWVTIPLKVSKTNPMSLKMETITMKIHENTVWDVELKLKFLKDLKINQKTNRVFSNRTTKSFVYYMEKARKQLELKNPISAHSGRNSCVKRMLLAGVRGDSICIALNWVRGSEMLYRYRNKLIEKSRKGAQYALHEYDSKSIGI
jgi:integrase